MIDCRAYSISEGIQNEFALKMTIQKNCGNVQTISHFEKPKEVLAKFITESNMENTESRILRFNRSNNNFQKREKKIRTEPFIAFKF